jgi:LmbE family N-acetylglucosaminyl deacetylase
MKLKRATAEIFVPDGLPAEEALARTTHLAVGAHQDDLEIMAVHAILACFQRKDRWFTGIVVSDGRGSPRAGLYKDYGDDAMREVRRKEQRKAALVGEYAAQLLLDYPSEAVKDGSEAGPAADLALLIRRASPETVYTHNLADKHDTHVAVALRTIAAIRSLPQRARPKRLYGCEVWRDLDWLLDTDKVAFDCSAQGNLQAALLGVFDSQIGGGKRYDLATLGRRRANATYFASHGTDSSTGLAFGMDLTPLIQDDSQDVGAYVQAFIKRFSTDVAGRLRALR